MVSPPPPDPDDDATGAVSLALERLPDENASDAASDSSAEPDATTALAYKNGEGYITTI